jgi:hypothetical protein
MLLSLRQSWIQPKGLPFVLGDATVPPVGEAPNDDLLFNGALLLPIVIDFLCQCSNKGISLKV